MEKILYVSDLDGTLMRKDLTISEYTAETINRLVEEGMIFSFATARSLVTASKVAAGIMAKVPLIVYNGAFIMENHTGKILASNYFSRQETETISHTLFENGIYPIVYAMRDGIEKYSYVTKMVSRAAREFLNSRKGDIRDNPLKEISELIYGEIFYFTCIDEEEKLRPVYEELKNEFYCIYQKDIYSGEQWLEILPRGASKASAVLRLKKMLGCTKIVSFGDGKNDIPMFRISDACYAVANADPELKEIATDVIESNEEDGVVKWLEKERKLYGNKYREKLGKALDI